MNNPNPPKLPLKLFRWFCSEERLEELEGDLFEVYQELVELKGTRLAGIVYWWLVIRSFRSFALKSTNRNKSLKIMTHFKHNFIISWRNILKNKTTSAINILGLSVGLATFLGIITLVRYELSFNKEVPDADRIYRIYTSFSGPFNGTNSGVAFPVGPYIEEHFESLESIAYFQTWSAKVSLKQNGEIKDFKRQRKLAVASPSYFDVINQYKWLAGNEKSLSEPFKVVLTDQQAEKYFGTRNWSGILNQEITYGDSLRLEVTGIVQQSEANSDFNFTDFISFETIEKSWLKSYFNSEWGNTNSSSQLFLKLLKKEDSAKLNNHLAEVDQHAASLEKNPSWMTNYLPQPLSEMHFDTSIGTFDNERSPSQLRTLIILSVVGFVILLIAIFNFINLETAQSTLKSKEVGVRKVLGSAKASLVGRFLTESGIITITSTFLAIPIVHFGLQYFTDFLPPELSIDYSNPLFWVILFLLMVIVSLLAGFYPAWVISTFKPINALKPGRLNQKLGGTYVRKALILLQFLFSQLLIFGTLIISWQISFMLDKELGFNDEGILYIQTPFYEEASKQEVLKNTIAEIPEISTFIEQGQLPIYFGWNTTTVKFDTDNGEEALSVHVKRIKEGYFKFYEIEMLAGEDLLPNDTLPYRVVNESFIHKMGYDDPSEAINQTFMYGDKPNYVRGVVKDYHFQSLHHSIEPMMFNYSEAGRYISFKASKENINTIVNKLTPTWNELYPDDPLEVSFIDDMIGRFYESERQTSKLTSIATVVAVLISCLGLFGLISFTIVRKTKEIGIRKVLGANTIQLSTILTKEFIGLIGMAFLISLPITYYFTQKFGEGFAYNAPISWWVYLLGGLTSIVIALISIGLKILKASKANPVDSLRYE